MKTSPVYKSEGARGEVMAAYEEILAGWPLELERLSVDTKAGKATVLAFGRPGDSPLVLLHGAGSNSSMWWGEAAGLAKNRRVYAVDLAGEPGLSTEQRLPTSDSSMAIWLGEVLVTLALREGWGERKPVLLGLSLGGWLALSYGIHDPDRVAGLVLLCPSGLSVPRKAFLAKAILAGLRGRAGFEALSASLYGDFPAPEEALRVGTVLAQSTNPRLGAIHRFTDGELLRLSMPIYLAVGEKDVILDSRQTIKRLSAVLPRTKVEIVAGGGHVFLGRCSPLGGMIEALGL